MHSSTAEARGLAIYKMNERRERDIGATEIRSNILRLKTRLENNIWSLGRMGL
jgi:hypothetical protein